MASASISSASCRGVLSLDVESKTTSPAGGELHRLAFVGLDTAFVELVDHPLTLPLVTAMSRICGPAPTPR